MRLLHIALGGCLRRPPVAYGVTADTGGHIAYVLGAATACAQDASVSAVDIATRRFDDPDLGPEFMRRCETIGPKLRLIRVAAGGRRYVDKEHLNAVIPTFADRLAARLVAMNAVPDVVHAHFADAALVGFVLRARFGCPVLYTPHSLGVEKPHSAVTDCGLTLRLKAEARALRNADAVIVSSRDEATRQMAAAGGVNPARVLIAPPGVDAPDGESPPTPLEKLLGPVAQSTRQLVLAVARPTPRKNLAGLVRAWAQNARLRETTDLVILAGLANGRDAEQRRERAAMQGTVDAVGATAHAAFPENHSRADVLALYRLAAARGGVFVNPALSEPYGLTTIEAARHGLPVIAPRRGGAAETVEALCCGVSVDTSDDAALACAIDALLSDRPLRDRFALEGQRRAAAQTWQAWSRPTLKLARRLRATASRDITRLLACDLDGTLTGDRAAAAAFFDWREANPHCCFAVATGRHRVEALETLWDWGLPTPDILIAACGTEIWWRDASIGWARDDAYAARIARDWRREAGEAALVGLMALQPQACQSAAKISYFGERRSVERARQRLRVAGLSARLVASHGRFIDVMPMSAGKGAALRWCADALGLALAQTVAAGDSGNDRDMLAVAGRAILVANHDSDLAPLHGASHVVLADHAHARGVLNHLDEVEEAAMAAE